MSSGYTVSAPAKLNLFLHITGQRDDGYHQLETVFQLLDWGDQLRFHPSDRISVHQTGEGQIPEQDNLVYKAARLLAEHSQVTRGIQIHLNKRLPSGAGLGGGSSDAATTLLALNQIWRTHLSLDQLAKLGMQLGADVPVFVRGTTAFASGIGEQLEVFNTPDHWFLVLTPRIHISTGQIFSNPQLTRDSPPIKIRALAAQEGRNDCQTVVETLYPGVAKVRKIMEKYAPAKMSGTGSSLFSEFESKTDAEQMLKNLVYEDLGNYSVFIARGINRSPVQAEVARLSG